MALGPCTMRNATLGFAQCVRPGGKPTATHCLDMYSLPGPLTGAIWLCAVALLLPLGPITSFIRLFYPEHATGVNSGRFLSLYWLFLRHPLAVQGEGPSNGDGLSSMCSSESLIYPCTRRNLQQGPISRDYWRYPAEAGGEGKPRMRDMFHDKVFCHRFFRSHGVACPTLVAEVHDHHVSTLHVPIKDAPAKLIWKPRYSTMGLGVEHFVSWHADHSQTWAPSTDPYLIEEHIQSTEYDHSEWYRCTTLWAHDEASPKSGYIWRMRNPKGDYRVQTDIMGGAYCVTTKHTPFIGPKEGGRSYDPRTGESERLDDNVHTALCAGIDQMVAMHANLGAEIYSVGWDLLVVNATPVFIEFNIGNGFYVADHTVEECWQMATFFSEQFHARLPSQLLNFDPHAADQAAEAAEAAATAQAVDAAARARVLGKGLTAKGGVGREAASPPSRRRRSKSPLTKSKGGRNQSPAPKKVR